VHAKARINWDEMAAGGVETLVISSGHEKMLDEPQVQVLARELRECLEKAQYPSSAPQVLAV
jgi:thioesterase domain-containing protein